MIWNTGAKQFTDALASSNPTPGGGAAAAMAGAMGCALVMMSIHTTLKRKNTPDELRALLEKSLQKLAPVHEQLKNLIAQDSAAYEAYLTAAKLPKEDPARTQAVQEALWQAACVPAQTAQICLKALSKIKDVRTLIAPVIISDVNCAQHLLKSAVTCCVENIRANAAYITNTAHQEQIKQWLNTFSQEAAQ